jgi:hypothetical protein
MLASALNMLLHLHSKAFTITRPGTTFTGAIRAAPSNYFRNLQGPSELVMPGREFVLSKLSLDMSGFGQDIKRGDRLTSSDLGTLSIVEVREMYDLGGAVMGYRIRTS